MNRIVLCAWLLTAPLAADDKVDFGRRIRPLLADNCMACHGPDPKTREGNLRLDTQAGLFGKGESGEFAVVPANPEKSTVYQRLVTKNEDELMPPADSGKKLTAEQIELVNRWIKQGAKWEQHWAFVAPVRPVVPKVESNWPKTDIDRFVLARLTQEKLQPSPAADRTALLRRLTYDLTGLPPTPREIDEFLADETPAAYEKAVDRLLRSPHYGEHMARFWLDAARYGDTHGLHLDNFRMIWPYRDWVVRAFNQGMPFDQFTIEQLAGDLLPNATQDQIVATGFNRCNVTTSEGGVIPEEYAVYYTNDRVATMSTVWMGISMGCVTCHESKFDPFEMRDFYSLYAFFNSLDGPVMDGNAKDTAPVLRLPTDAQRNELASLDERIATLTRTLNAPRPDLDREQQQWERDFLTVVPPPEIVSLLQIEPAKRNDAQREQLREHFRSAVRADASLKQTRDELAAARKRRAEVDGAVALTLVWKEAAEPRPAHILLRGAYDKPGERVYRNTPAALPPLGKLAEGETPTRLHLAKWLVSPEHPLTARVIVNRFWQQYFGVGIVETSEDFGSQGTPPSHPELLDWLAVDFRESGWDVKRLQKLIVMSATYQQSAKLTPELAKVDPRNRLLARGPRFRMDAEMIRDTALAASGLLIPKLGGPSVKPYQPAGIWEAVGYTDSNTARFSRDSGEALYRRTLYTFWKKTAPPPTLVNFDAPSRETCSVRRSRTNTPLAALALMNDEQYVEASRQLARRVLLEGGENDVSRATYGFRLATGRRPTAAELEVLLDVFRSSLSRFAADKGAASQLNSVGETKPDPNLDASQLAAWSMVANLALNLDETITK